MEIEAVKKQGGYFICDNSQDSALSKIKNDSVVILKVASSQNCLEYIRFYWGHFLPFVLNYWKPRQGLISSEEINLVNHIMECRKKEGLPTDKKFYNNILKGLAISRCRKMDLPPVTKEALHEEIKRGCGYVEYIRGTKGIIKKTTSISFAKMSENERRIFYQKAEIFCYNSILEPSGAFDSIDTFRSVIR